MLAKEIDGKNMQNCKLLLSELKPDILITSGGALVKYNKEYIFSAEFTAEETRQAIAKARKVCGDECEIANDTVKTHYWNYKIDPMKLDQSWGLSIYTDFSDFQEKTLKMCVEIFDSNAAEQLKRQLDDYDCIRFSDGYWYKFT